MSYAYSVVTKYGTHTGPSTSEDSTDAGVCSVPIWFGVWPYALMRSQRTIPPIWRTLLVRLFCSLLLGHGLPTAYAQHSPPAAILNNVPADGLLLKEGWRFQPGDNPNGASPELDDSQWSSIDPTKDIRDLPQLQQAGIGWLRVWLKGPIGWVSEPLLSSPLFSTNSTSRHPPGSWQAD